MLLENSNNPDDIFWDGVHSFDNDDLVEWEFGTYIPRSQARIPVYLTEDDDDYEEYLPFRKTYDGTGMPHADDFDYDANPEYDTPSGYEEDPDDPY